MATLQSVKQLAEASLALAASGSGGSGSGKPGKNCTVQKTEPIDGGTRVTFSWTADDGSAKTTSVNIMNGADGADGANCKIKSITYAEAIDHYTGETLTGNAIEFEWTDNDGTTRTSDITVWDGQRGARGPKGNPGEDGISPVISVSAIPGGHRVAITDATNTETFDVMDGDGGQAESIDWSKITNKPDDLATTKDVEKKVFIAEYNVTSAQEIIAYLDSSKEPFAPMLVKRGADYYTVITTAKQADNKIIIRTFATLSGVFYVFTYTITNAAWSNSNYGVQKVLVSGTDIKTVNGESLLGSGDIVVSGDSVLTADLNISKAIGGIPAGKKYAANTSFETIFRDMLNPVENPTLTNPTATISAQGGTLVEEGETAQKTLTVTFNRGSINPAYGTSGNRSGAATGYSLNGGAQQTGNTFSVAVTESNKTFTARVDYAAGEQPKNSAGKNYSTPLEAGFVNTNTLTFEIVAALWSNAANITQIAKETLISKTVKQKQFNFPAQTAANPEVFDVPATWTVTAVELLNTLNNQWVDGSSEFTATDITHGTVAYKRYTYNGGDSTGARSVRIKWG